MRLKTGGVMAFGLALILSGSARADTSAKAMEIVDKAIEAHGGEAEMKKLSSNSMKMKGTVHVMGMEIAFMGDTSSQEFARRRVDLEMEVANQKFRIVNVFNKDKGWAKVNDQVTEMTKDQVAGAVDQAHSNWVASLLPLKDKAYTLSLVGEGKVGTTPVLVITVTRKDRRDVNLSFDKKTHLLLKVETRVKDEQSGEEKTEEAFFSDYNDKGLKQPKKITVNRDGKLFVEAEVSDLRVDEKFDESVFGKP